jgi:pyrimidine-specific ribonucleoside hydrolase
MRKVLLCFVITLNVLSAIAHPWKPNYFVIIDTDCGIDDFRTLHLLLANPTIQVLGITVSNGAVPAELGYQKVKSLLAALHHEGVLVGIQKKAVSLNPFDVAIQFNWSDSTYSHWPEVEALEIVDRIIRYQKEPITYLNLGSLETFSLCMQQNPQFKSKIKEVVWSIDSIPNTSWNYKLSPTAYHDLINGKQAISAICSGFINYTEDLKSVLHSIHSANAQSICQSLCASNAWYSQTLHDEMVALYLTDSSCFTVSTNGIIDANPDFNHMLSQIFEAVFTGNNVNKLQALQSLSVDSNLFLPDISYRMVETIDKYGETEWASCVLTNELHRHVGIYAIIGAKMGIRAREYFGVGGDVMQVTSFAGNNPPVSCMNDGIQVSTGATVGHGLLHLAAIDVAEPKFMFEYMGQQIVIRLKSEYKNKLKKDVKQLELIYGLDSTIYWDLVRQVALNCWFSWNRNQIFIIEPVK